ncbi:LysR substrate-binding domain-containing protein [Spirillospora sp. CA-294931]|uniref:LysR substrate-binding domain-containing protein n=1 Tax=Spirillospora sp. CA-294931 TaxID=3240042 RepID=UPI003D8B3899
MDVQRLLILRQIARSGSIAGAARALGWTQPAVSQHLRTLERQAGMPLVVRRPRGIQLTEAGAVLLGHADAIATRLDAASGDLDALAHLRGGTVRVAAFPSASATLVPQAMGLLNRDHPGLDVRLREAEPPEALELLRSGDVDLAVTFSHASDNPDLRNVRLAEDPVRLVLPASSDKPSGLAALADEKWIAGCERCTAHLVQACAEAGFVPDIRHGTDDYVVTQTLIAQGLGVGLLPGLALDAFRHPDVAVHDLPGLPPRVLYAVHHHEADRIPAVHATVQALTRVAAAAD